MERNGTHIGGGVSEGGEESQGRGGVSGEGRSLRGGEESQGRGSITDFVPLHICHSACPLYTSTVHITLLVSVASPPSELNGRFFYIYIYIYM